MIDQGSSSKQFMIYHNKGMCYATSLEIMESINLEIIGSLVDSLDIDLGLIEV